ncbi:MAG: hypothetical protein ACKOE5_13325 [Cytophagales bacterium]
MSSHHFVKEGQEPTLIILSILPASFEHVQSLLEWSPKVLVADSSLETVLHWGIKIDGVIVQQSQRHRWQQELKDQEPLHWMEYPNGSLRGTLTALSSLNNQKLQIVDDEEILPLPDLQTLACDAIAVIRHSLRWSLIRGGKWTKWVPAGTILLVVYDGNTSEQMVPHDGNHTIILPSPFWVGELL